MPGIVGINRLGVGSLTANPQVQFPLRASSSGRYLVDSNGKPFRAHGEQHWLAPMSFSAADFQAVINVLASQGINSVTMMAICHDYEEHTGKTPGTGPQSQAGFWPFGLDTTGAAYAGTGISSPPNGSTPLATIWADFSTASTQSSYWSVIDNALSVCLAACIVVFFFPAYMGYQGKIEGWAADKFESGSTKCATYGTFLGNRYKGQRNIIWMMGGDFDPSTWNSSYSGLVTCEEQMFLAIRAAGANQIIGGHFPYHNGLASDISNTSSTLAALVGINTVYAWLNEESMYQQPLAAWGFSPPIPALLHDPGSAYEGSGPSELTNRQDWWWGAVSSVGGQMMGNQPDWYSGSGTFASVNTSSGMLSTGHTQHQYRGQFFNAVPWWKLLPEGQGGMGTIVTSGNGTNGNTDWITASADPAGSLLVAYIPDAHSGAFTVSLTTFTSSHIVGAWYDPTNGTYAPTSGSPYSGSSQSFTVPGANSAGNNDWVLMLTA